MTTGVMPVVLFYRLSVGKAVVEYFVIQEREV